MKKRYINPDRGLTLAMVATYAVVFAAGKDADWIMVALLLVLVLISDVRIYLLEKDSHG